MGFFDRDDGDPGDGRPVGGAGERGVPMEAEERLSGLNASSLFTSTLSVSEFALLSELGPRPVAQVLGTAVHHVGWQYLPPEAQWGGNEFFCQLDVVSRAWDDARRNAFDRLSEEGRLVGADAVVGVRLRRGQHDWARHCVDFVVSGTGIRFSGDHAGGQPTVLSDLSVQEYWLLANGGWTPAGLLAATSVVFVSQGLRTRWRRRLTVARNQELIEFSDGFTAARRSVVATLRGQARSVNAHGVVGVSLQYEITRGKFVVRNTGSGPNPASGLSMATVAVGGDLPRRGADKRAGVVITVHAVGSAIRRERSDDRAPIETMLGLGQV